MGLLHRSVLHLRKPRKSAVKHPKIDTKISYNQASTTTFFSESSFANDPS